MDDDARNNINNNWEEMEINKNYDDSSLEFYAHWKDDDGEQQDNVVMKSTKPTSTRDLDDDGGRLLGTVVIKRDGRQNIVTTAKVLITSRYR